MSALAAGQSTAASAVFARPNGPEPPALALTHTPDGWLHFAWTAAAVNGGPPVTGYRLHLTSSPDSCCGSLSLYTTFDGATLQFDTPDPSAGAPHGEEWVLTAVNDVGESVPSNSVYFVSDAPAPPQTALVGTTNYLGLLQSGLQWQSGDPGTHPISGALCFGVVDPWRTFGGSTPPPYASWFDLHDPTCQQPATGSVGVGCETAFADLPPCAYSVLEFSDAGVGDISPPLVLAENSGAPTVPPPEAPVLAPAGTNDWALLSGLTDRQFLQLKPRGGHNWAFNGEVGGAGCSDFHDGCEARVLDTTNPVLTYSPVVSIDTNPPSSPTNVTAIPNGNDPASVTVAWEPPATNGGWDISTYRVEMSPDPALAGDTGQNPNHWELLTTRPGDGSAGLSADVHCPSLPFGASCRYRVIAMTPAGDSLPGVVIPTVSIGNASVVEGDTGKARTITFPVTLSQPSSTAVTVHYAIQSTGSATVSKTGDVAPKSGTVTFKPNAKTGKTATTAFVSLKVNPDTGVEGDETFNVVLSSPSAGYGLGTATATGTILDDDPASGLRVSVGDVSIIEGNSGVTNQAKVNVTLNSPATANVTVVVTVSGVTASGGTDFKNVKTKTLTFKKDQWQHTVSVAVYPDAAVEPNETIHVTLSSPSGTLALGRSVGTITIANDD